MIPSEQLHNLIASSQDHPDGPAADHLLLHLIAGVGPRLRQALLDQLGSVEAVFQASGDQLRQISGVGPKVAAAVLAARSEIDLAAELEVCRRHRAGLLFDSHQDYPQLLGQLPDQPAVLYVKGELTSADRHAVAIVGTRHASRYGETQARRLAGELAQAGVTVVSGLARGIDAAAHRGALEAGGRTIAVLGGGLAKLYPPEHRTLASEIVEQGAVVSEFPMRTQPAKGTFPQRNRIISGLSLGVIVVEAGQTSGALSTAAHALEQDRQVFAVPGQLDNPQSQGCHQLIRQGAVLIRSAADILEELQPADLRLNTLAVSSNQAQTASSGSRSTPSPVELSEEETAIVAAIDSAPTLTDDVIANCGLPAQKVMHLITMLEIRQIVRRCAGNRLQRLV